MSELPYCPCCGEDGLRIESRILENGQWHYVVKCDCCNVEFHHEEFYGYNSTTDFFEKYGRGECEFIHDKQCEHQNYWFCHCSSCGYEANTVLTEGNEGRDAWNFCPKCGSEVRR